VIHDVLSGTRIREMNDSDMPRFKPWVLTLVIAMVSCPVGYGLVLMDFPPLGSTTGNGPGGGLVFFLGLIGVLGGPVAVLVAAVGLIRTLYRRKQIQKQNKVLEDIVANAPNPQD